MRRLQFARNCAGALLMSWVCADASAQGVPATPAPGSAERRAIMDDLRAARQTPDQIFIVDALKVLDGWAYIVVRPQTRSGGQRFETEALVLRRQSGRWTLVDALCTEDDLNSDDTCNVEKSIARVRKANPAAPASIFP